MIKDTLYILSGYLCALPVLFGLGRLTSFALRMPARGRVTRVTVDRLWLGLAAVLMGVSFLQLFWRVSGVMSGVVGAMGLFGCVWRSKRARLDGWGIVLLGGASVLLLWTLLRAMLPVNNYDSGLYHFNTIRWFNTYPIVPGLGNLHGRLAFNQSYFLYVAALNASPWFGHAHNIASGLVVWLLLVTMLEGALGVFQHWKGGPIRAYDAGCLLLFLPSLWLAVTADVSSPSPDAMAFALQMVTWLWLVRVLDAQRDPISIVPLSALALLCCSSTTAKASNLVFAATAGAVAVVFLISRQGRPVMSVWEWLRSSIVGACVLGIWLVRGAILSGWPLYPSTALHVPLDFAVDRREVLSQMAWIRSWARRPFASPDEVLGNWDWLGDWWDWLLIENAYRVIYPLCVFVGGSMLLFALRWLRRSWRSLSPRLFLAVAPLVLGLVFWFWSAPDIRFSNALFWLLPVGLLIPVAVGGGGVGGVVRCCFVALTINAALVGFFFMRMWLFSNVSRSGISEIPVVELKMHTTASGLGVYVPVGGDQSWDAPLPATPYFSSALRLNGGEMERGFRVAE